MKTTVLLTRHGETERSRADLYYGRTQSPVTARGMEQQVLLSRRLSHLPIAAIYSSPLDRCVHAATMIGEFHNIVPAVVEGLVEINHGLWEGLGRQEVEAHFGGSYLAWQSDPAANAPEGGESGYEVASRVLPIINGLARSHIGQTIVIMAHNTVNRIALCHFLNLPLSEYRRRIVQSPAAINELVFSGNTVRAVCINNVAHWDSTASDQTP